MKFTIDRKYWIRGTGGKGSTLLRSCHTEEKEMCCLGFFAKALGHEDEVLTSRATPEDVCPNAPEHNLFPEKFVDRASDGQLFENGGTLRNTRVTLELMAVNDGHAREDCIMPSLASSTVVTNEADREDKITKLFASVGIEVEFVGEGVA